MLTLATNLIWTLSSSAQCTVDAGNNLITCQGSPLNLDGSSTGNPDVVWSSVPAGFIASGGTSLSPTINTNVTGLFTLTITGNNGECSDNVTVTIIGPPVINFPPSIPCGGDPIQFSTNQQPGFVYSWDYDDGSNNGNGTNVQHTYNQISGGDFNSYQVELTATNNVAGCSLPLPNQ